MEEKEFVVSEEGQKYLNDLQTRLLKLAQESEYVDVEPEPPPTVSRLISGGSTSCTSDYWRGRRFCLHTIVKLKVLAGATGALYMDPIQGSYTSSTSASAGTHSRGGAGDINHSKWSETQDNSVMNIARDIAFLIYWDRDAISGVWSDHGHFIDPSCPNLSPEAAAQVVDFYNGHNGLANDGADFGSRKSVTKLWNMYLNRSKTTVSSIEALFATKEWWEMANIPDDNLAQIRDAVWGKEITWTGYKSVLNNLGYAASRSVATLEAVESLKAQVATLAIKQTNDIAAMRADLSDLKALIESLLGGGVVNPNPGPVNPWPTITGPVYGFDHSRYQPAATVTQQALDSGKYAFAIFKATEGKGWTSSEYDSQMARARAKELMTGAYHFWWPTNPVEADFTNFINKAKLQLGELPVLDVENWDQVNNGADMKNLPGERDRLLWALSWLEMAEEHYGAPPWIYLNWDWIKQLRFGSGQAIRNSDGTVTIKPATDQTELWKRLTHFPLWIATAGRAPGNFETISGGWNAGVVCHQYTDSPFDLNYMPSTTPHEVWWASGIRKEYAA